MNGRNGPAVGTAFHPQAEPDLNGRARAAQSPLYLARLPRRRRPGMIALACALVGAGMLASTAVYTATNHRVPVIVVTADVPPGAVIEAGSVGTADVSAGSGVQVIPASQLSGVIGQIAGTSLHPGMLLTASELARSRPPGPGQVLVPLPVRPSVLPADGLDPGDQVLVVATPGAQGQSGSAGGAPALGSPVAGVVESVSQAVDADGFEVVDLIVSAGAGAVLAQQASTGQFALVITKRVT
ncbi:MAG TPA: SAF domain-containing protein [Streptosporangiaceae bacterium]|nr:SAF domain-containing protein [Streptosporangiaceae bacterium]